MLFCLVIVRLVFDYVQILCAIIRITSKRCSVNNYKGGLEMVNKTLEKMERSELIQLIESILKTGWLWMAFGFSQ